MIDSARTIEVTTLEAANPHGVWLLLVVVLAILLVIVVYGREGSPIPRWKRWSLMFLRCLTLSLAGWMWFGWQFAKTPVEKSDLLVVVDTSLSMSAADEVLRPQQPPISRFAAVVESMTSADRASWEQLGRDYRLVWSLDPETGSLASGSSEELLRALRETNANRDRSPLGEQLLTAANQQRGRSTAAVLFITDGNVTDGAALSTAAEQLRTRMLPLYIVGVGKSQPNLDWRIERFSVDDQAYVGDTLRLQVRVAAVNVKDATTLKLYVGDEPQAKSEVPLLPQSTPQDMVLLYRAEKAGIDKCRVEIVPVAGEQQTDNNRAQGQVQVNPIAAKVLLTWGYPSYEFRYLKGTLERDLTVEDTEQKLSQLRVHLQDADPEFDQTDLAAMRSFPSSLEALQAFDVIVLGDVNLTFLGPSAVEHLAKFVTEKGGSLVIIAGDRFGFSSYANTPLMECLPFEQLPDRNAATSDKSFRVFPTPLGFATNSLQLADAESENTKTWSQLPSLFWRQPLPKLRAGVRVLATARESGSGQSTDLITSQFVGAGQVLFHATDESHRWRFRRGDAHFARYWQQTIRSLSRRKLENDRVQLAVSQSRYRLGQPVPLSLTFSNERLAAGVGSEITAELETAGLKPLRVNLTRDPVDPRRFVGEATDLTAGSYQVTVIPPEGAIWGTSPANNLKGGFVVELPPGESTEALLQETECREAAEATGGSYQPLSQVGKLLAELPPPRLAPAAAKTTTSVWNSPWLAAVVVLLLCVEWWWRQRLGLF